MKCARRSAKLPPCHVLDLASSRNQACRNEMRIGVEDEAISWSKPRRRRRSRAVSEGRALQLAVRHKQRLLGK